MRWTYHLANLAKPYSTTQALGLVCVCVCVGQQTCLFLGNALPLHLWLPTMALAGGAPGALRGKEKGGFIPAAEAAAPVLPLLTKGAGKSSATPYTNLCK